MLSLRFFQNDNVSTLDIDEHCYERLAKSGLDSKVNYSNYSIEVEGEKYDDVFAVKLNFDNRYELLKIVESERHNELMKMITKFVNPTIKEIEEVYGYAIVLTEMYEMIKSEDNLYFSYV